MRVATTPQPELIAAMADTGYARGGFLPILSFRLDALPEHVGDGRLDGLAEAAATGDPAVVEARLGVVLGFGPRSIASAWMLFTSIRR